MCDPLLMHDIIVTLCRWMITESNDVSTSGNVGVWKELLEKLMNMKPMYNEDFIAIQNIMEVEEETRQLKHATLQEITQLESDLHESRKLESIVECLQPNVNQQQRELDERLKKLSTDFPEFKAGLMADSNGASFSAKHDKVLLAWQKMCSQLERYIYRHKLFSILNM